MPGYEVTHLPWSIYPLYGALIWIGVGLSQVTFLVVFVDGTTGQAIVTFVFVTFANTLILRSDAILPQRHWLQGLSFSAARGIDGFKPWIFIVCILLPHV